MVEKDFCYGVVIEHYSGSEEVVTIPEEIGGIPVTAIGNGAFNEREISLFEEPKNLTEIYIPESVKYIGENAFAYCESLTKITIASEDSIYIAENAFIGCVNLTDVVITASNPIEINFDALENCCSIERVYIDTSSWSYASVREIFGDEPGFEILP